MDPYGRCVHRWRGGVAGAMVAYTLGRAGISTIVLEAGPRHRPADRPAYMDRYLEGKDPWRSDMPERDVFANGGEVDYPLNDYRVKAVGGTTLHWIGYTPRFHPNDFNMRSRYGIGEDWPIGYEELEPFYSIAESEMGVAGAEDNPFAGPRSGRYPLPAFPTSYDEQFLVRAGEEVGIQFHSMPQARNSEAYGGRQQCLTYGNCRACPIRAKYSGDVHIERAEATGNVEVVANANVLRLETDGSGRVARAVYADPDRTEHACEARTFVIAAHAVESARLLLLSASPEYPDGLANSSGMVGKFFMEHMGQYRLAEVNYPLYPHRTGFTTVHSEQFRDPDSRGDESGFLVRGNAAGPRYHEIVANVALRNGNWGEDFARELKRQTEESFGRTFLIGTNAEPLPVESNRVELEDSVLDYFGNPRPKLFYSISEYERAGYVSGNRVIERLADAMGGQALGSVHNHFGGHQAGTCRMGNTPETSVVDSDLRAHDVRNLYVVGSANFVTLSTVNPTLTIAALALRLGKHLQQGST